MKTARYLIALFFLISMKAHSHTSSQEQFMGLLQNPEIRILDISDHVYNGEFDVAENELNALITDSPDFQLAHLIYAEVMTAKSGMGPGFSDWLTPLNKEQSNLVDEIRKRHAHNREAVNHTQGKIPDFLLQLSPSQKQVIIVDSSLSRAHVFENINSELSLAGDYYITVGKNGILKTVEGDGRTPMGVYFITSRLNPNGLEDLYGAGALPLNYPNEWDQRLERSGFGIWLHGVPSDTYNRAPFETEGCVAFPNEDIEYLYNTPDIKNTPVIITDQINWVEKSQNIGFQQTVSKNIEAWRSSWASGDMDQINRYYAHSFSNGILKRDSWLKAKEKVLMSSISNEFEIRDLSIFKYPGVSGLVVVSFYKEYLKDIKSERSPIRQYWGLDGGKDWRIFYEGPAEYQPIHFKGIPKAVNPILVDESRRHKKHDKHARGS